MDQPLPTVLRLVRDKHPEWFKKFGRFLFGGRIIVRFHLAPRRPRLIAAGLLIFLQLAIAITGNTASSICSRSRFVLLLIDDASLRASFADLRACSRRLAARGARASHSERLQIANFAAIVRSRHYLAPEFLALLHRAEARG